MLHHLHLWNPHVPHRHGDHGSPLPVFFTHQLGALLRRHHRGLICIPAISVKTFSMFRHQMSSIYAFELNDLPVKNIQKRYLSSSRTVIVYWNPCKTKPKRGNMIDTTGFPHATHPNHSYYIAPKC